MLTEQGPSIGTHNGRTVPEYIVDQDGQRYDYNRVAVLDPDGGFTLSKLRGNEVVIAPGLIYRAVKRQTP